MTASRIGRVLLCLGWAALVVAMPVSLLDADDSLRSADQLWLISTRRIGCIDADQLTIDDLAIRRWNRATLEWEDATWQQLKEGESRTAWTALYVHGNRVEPGEDTYHGRAWYRVLADSVSAPPVQFVIWSWPSSQIRGQLKDVRAKFIRAQYEADYLGWYLERAERERPTLFLGFSYGGLIVPGALAYNATNSVEASRAGLRPWSVFLIAAAEPVGWLQPGGSHGEAFSQVRHAVVLVNFCDPALKRFGVVDRCARPRAVGYAGLVRSAYPPETRQRIDIENVSSIIGKLHDEHPYRASGAVGSWLKEAVEAIAPSTGPHAMAWRFAAPSSRSGSDHS